MTLFPTLVKISLRWLTAVLKHPDNYRRPGWLLLIALLPMLGAPPALAGESLRMAVSQSPLSLPVFIAEQFGYFDAEGLDVRITPVFGGHRAMQELLDGRADLATSSESVVMFNSFQRNDFAILATFVTSGDDVKIVCRTDQAPEHPSELSGKRVGTVMGAASHYYLDSLLLLNGVDPATVEKIPLQPEQMAEALHTGKVDAVSIWEPYPFRILGAVPGARILPQTQSDIYRLTFNLISGRQLLGTRDAELIRLLRALERAEQFIASRPDEAQALLRAHLKLDPEFIGWIWPDYQYRLTLDQSLLTTLESEARWALREGHVKPGQAPNYLDFIYSLPLKAINPAAASLIE